MIRSRRNTKPPSARKSELPVGGGLLTRGALPTPPSQPGGQWHVGAGASPLTAAGPFRIRTGFPDRSPVVARDYHRRSMTRSRVLSLWAPVLLWAGVIFALSSIPSLGTGLGTWDYV